MATFREAPERATALLRDIEADFKRERDSKGRDKPHVSDIIHCLYRAWFYRQGGEQAPNDNDSTLRLMTGHALHAVIARSASDQRAVNVPLETEWLVGEADAVVFGPEGGIEDAKTTYLSTNTGQMPLLKPDYVEQIATYLVMAARSGYPFDGVHPRAIIHALHLAGNYKFPLAVQLKTWEIEFTPDELLRWAAELDRRARLLLADEAPSKDECGPIKSKSKTGQSWECDYCPLHVARGGFCEGSQGRPAGFFALDDEDGDLI